MTAVGLDPRTPVVIGVGQVAERIEDPGYAGLSPIDLAVEAARAAVADSQADAVAVIAAVDSIAATRQFENSSSRAVAPLGKSTKFPLSVAHRLGAAPKRAVLDVVGGQSPQHLVSEFSRKIEAGLSDVVLLVGAEAISTIRHYALAEHKPDFSDDPAGQIEDRGFGLTGVATPAMAGRGMGAPSTQYALLENARRAAQGRSREEYATAMGELFAPFTKVAAKNPFSAAPAQRSADELVAVTERNRMIADPYPRFVVARDQVRRCCWLRWVPPGVWGWRETSGYFFMGRPILSSAACCSVRCWARRLRRLRRCATHWRSPRRGSTTSTSLTSIAASPSPFSTSSMPSVCRRLIPVG
jgi:acetyl-CoA C-acetyltransferase